MKNTGPPDSNHKTPTLTPELRKFIESMGVYFENQGIPRIGGRILGLLMVAHTPLSAEYLASTLKVSRGSISTNFRILIAAGLVEKVTFHGERTTHFAFSETAWEQLMAIAIQRGAIFKKIAEQGVVALPAGDSSQHRLQRAIEWTDFMIESYQKMIAEWRARQQQPAIG